MREILGATVLILFAAQALPSGWGILGDQKEMEGNVIVEVGEVSKIQPPYGVKWNVD
jgi:hypothetical protein